MVYGLVLATIFLIVIRFFVLVLYLKEEPITETSGSSVASDIQNKKMKPKLEKRKKEAKGSEGKVSIFEKFANKNKKKSKEKELQNLDVDLQIGGDVVNNIDPEQIGVQTRKFNSSIFEQMEEIGDLEDEPIGMGESFKKQTEMNQNRPFSEKYPELLGIDKDEEMPKNKVFNKKNEQNKPKNMGYENLKKYNYTQGMEKREFGNKEINNEEKTEPPNQQVTDLTEELNQAEQKQSNTNFDFNNYFSSEKVERDSERRVDDNAEEPNRDEFLDRFKNFSNTNKESEYTPRMPSIPKLKEQEEEPKKPAFLSMDRGRDSNEKTVNPPIGEEKDDLASLKKKIEQLKNNVNHMKE